MDYKQYIEMFTNFFKLGEIQTNLADKDGVSPLLIAARDNSLDFCKILVANNANQNAMNKKGETALSILIDSKNVENVETILKLGADPNQQDHNGRISLHIAVNNAETSADASFDMEALLIRQGANVNAIDKRGRTPLHYAFVKIGKPFNQEEIDPIETVTSLLGV